MTVSTESNPLHEQISLDHLDALDSASFAAIFPQLMTRVIKDEGWLPDSPRLEQLRRLIHQRIEEPGLIAAISAILNSSQSDDAQNESRLIGFTLDCLRDIPETQLHNYRPALATLSQIDADSHSQLQWSSSLARQAQGMIKFIDDRTAVWTPFDKLDEIAERTLQERVHTAEQMRPHIDGLLSWLQDRNWPVFGGCERQLGRFPDLAVEGIRSAIRQYPDDEEWILNMLRFMETYVPVGPLWESVYPQVKEIRNRPVGAVKDGDLLEYAARWSGIVDQWRGRSRESVEE